MKKAKNVESYSQPRSQGYWVRENPGNEVAPPPIARITPTSFPELFPLDNGRGDVTVIRV